MTNSASLLAVSQKIHQILDDNRAELGIEDVFFGDQARVPRTPAVCVEPGIKERVLIGTQRYTTVTHQVFILIYHAKVQDKQETLTEAMTFGEAVETKINANATLDGLVIHGYVTNLESGYTQRGPLYMTLRLTYEATARQNLPLPV